MKKWMQCAVSVALAGCFALSLTACKEEDAPGESAVITAGQQTGSSKATPRGTNLVKIYWK